MSEEGELISGHLMRLGFWWVSVLENTPCAEEIRRSVFEV